MEGRRGLGREEQQQQQQQRQQGGDDQRPLKRARGEEGDNQPPSPSEGERGEGKEERVEGVYQRTVFVKRLDLPRWRRSLRRREGRGGWGRWRS